MVTDAVTGRQSLWRLMRRVLTLFSSPKRLCQARRAGLALDLPPVIRSTNLDSSGDALGGRQVPAGRFPHRVAEGCDGPRRDA
jgi:hypothetical protein